MVVTYSYTSPAASAAVFDSSPKENKIPKAPICSHQLIVCQKDHHHFHLLILFSLHKKKEPFCTDSIK